MEFDRVAYLNMGEFESSPDLLSVALEQLSVLSEDTISPEVEILDRYRQASATVLDFFNRLQVYAVAEDFPEFTQFDETTPISYRIIRCISGYQDLMRVNVGVENLLTEAYEEVKVWEKRFWDLCAEISIDNEPSEVGDIECSGVET
jgi:hypothetical protein